MNRWVWRAIVHRIAQSDMTEATEHACMHVYIYSIYIFICYCLVTQSCPTLEDPMDCSPPGSSVHGTSQARILERVAIPFSRGSSWPGDGTRVSCITGGLFTIWAIRPALVTMSRLPQISVPQSRLNRKMKILSEDLGHRAGEMGAQWTWVISSWLCQKSNFWSSTALLLFRFFSFQLIATPVFWFLMSCLTLSLTSDSLHQQILLILL